MIPIKLGRRTYLVDEWGNITKIRGSGLKSVHPDKDGYLKVTCMYLDEDGVYKTYNGFVHRIVYEAFHGEIPEDMTVDHIDNDKLNNHKDNLQLLTAVDNSNKSHAKHWTVTTPDGDQFEVWNLEKFCRDNKLHASHIKTGTYKGWKARRVDG
ncbi:HNH endonuclease protein [Rhizobium phage RHph_I3_11]|nr:HNH endonuclease protein [Rhizobium phage RHph_I3_11]